MASGVGTMVENLRVMVVSSLLGRGSRIQLKEHKNILRDILSKLEAFSD